MQVSVIIPAFNAAQYLRQCFDSILQSEILDLEIIGVDDGSTDDTLSILREYELENPRVHAVSQKNQGTATARNQALAIATGEYIGFVDADDWVEPTMFTEMVETAKREDADIVFCNIFRNQSEKMRKYLRTGSFSRSEIEDEIFPLLISCVSENRGQVTLRGSVCCRIFRRSLIENHNIRFDEELVYNEDGLFEIEATLQAAKYVYLGDSYLYHNRTTVGSVTKRYIPDLWLRQRGLRDKLLKVTSGSDYDFSEQIAKKMLEVAIYCIENLNKASCPLSVQEKNQEIRMIMADPVLRESLSKIQVRNLKRINQGYFWAIRLQLPKVVSAISRYRERMHQK